MHDLTLEQKVGQLFLAPYALELHTDLPVGGFLLKQGTARALAEGIAQLQAESPIPLLIAADSEWGLGMRISDAPTYPRAGTLAATHPDLIYEMARQIALQGKLLGIHLHLGPVADLNTNPANPVIGTRSFGSDPQAVAPLVAAYIAGIESTGALACVKHFPGHGDTAVDSHYALPLLLHSRARLETLEWIPFFSAPASALMTAHLLTPALDPRLPTTLSPTTGPLLRSDLHFQGLLITDALNMRALSAYTPAETALLAYQAGHDLLLYGAHLLPDLEELNRVTLPAAYNALLQAFQSGALPLDELDRRVARILQAKERAHWLPYLESDLELLIQTIGAEELP